MRRGSAIAMALILTVCASACVRWPGHGGSGGGTLGRGNGYVDQRSWRARQDAYLRFATEDLNRSSIPNVIAHLARSERDRHYRFDARSVKASDFQAVFDKIDGHVDTSDFDMMRLMALWWGYRGRLDPGLRQAVEQRFTGFRYWFTDPLPDDVVDDKWFWSENHRLIVHVLEYLAGRALPRSTFEFTGLEGRDHADRGRQRIEEWLDEKADFGFSEWHSDVYYAKDLEPLLLLTEFAEPDLARRAAAMLDLFLFDIAVHQRAGNMGVTHGRSYMKDKSRAVDQDVFNITKLAFDTTSLPYTSRGDATVIALARADRYRLPAVLVRVAQDDAEFVDRQHMGVPLELDGPLEPLPASAPGTPAYDDPDGIPFWWERGALTAWPIVPLTVTTIEERRLWETSLFQPFKPLVDIAGGDLNVAQALAYNLRCIINLGVLSEVDTITYRTGDTMLSTAQDYRPGCHGNQYHPWQATLDEDAIVFTSHPGNEPRAGNRWVDADLYWGGGSTLPRAAQQGSANIVMYAPQYTSPGAPLESFGYLDYTHAYFPTERFDEVRQVGGWTLGRSGDGYVALWSWRPTEWRTHDPAETFTNGLTQPFDLVAPGGATNVWISEVGDAARWGSFDAFADAVTAAPITVTDLGRGADGLADGFDVSYSSPTQGDMAFSWTGPLTVDGAEVDLHPDARIDNPFATVAVGSDRIHIRDGRDSLDIDLATGARRATTSRRR